MAFSFFKKRKKTEAEIPEDDQEPEQAPEPEERSPEEIPEAVPPPPAAVEDTEPEEPADAIAENKTAPSPAPAADFSEPKSGFYGRLRRGLEKTRRFLTTDVDKLFVPGKKLDDQTLEDLEELLITADIGVKATTELIAGLSKQAAGITDPDHLKEAIKEMILPYLEDDRPTDEATRPLATPHVIMVIGVNGVGKTTTIGKLAARHRANGKKVMLVAADTFRAAAIEQLSIWADRTGADILKHRENSDPAAVAYDGVEAARARGVDVVIVDTAGRLHTKVNLMEELKKIKRSMSKTMPDAPHEVLLVLDATTGQNAISQTELFTKAADVTGIVLTKLDGTAKGGIAINLRHSFGIPIQYIGVGEQVEDLQPFDPRAFLDAMF
ncbi:signal recognition particle-docking protein FtsY [Desulfosudis oleivorans]|uniref:Signal recognition particle receptor FtsY n=1 Tax=Desulfosudis oleivorans (strain DSM 6200 / JCM 39069 / Hxd3) TaxID=96561 RepID=A9A0M2_DESOH|nr:signal recognition particle-docking protein FtsY [Desulfosudis oleivorans]ABW67522.1 signal recognition particle-docking protein FtsY [Desulfosudis oleivorans Hxd3]